MYDNVILWPTVAMAMTLNFDTEAKETAKCFVYPSNAFIQNLIQFKIFKSDANFQVFKWEITDGADICI